MAPKFSATAEPYCYTRDAERRNRYRSTSAHNVLAIDGLEQNTISQDKNDLFRCGNEAAVTPIVVHDGGEAIVLSPRTPATSASACTAAGYSDCRRAGW